MPPPRLVHLRTVHDPFHARVIVARLAADGIMTELQGGGSALYPFGSVAVFVGEQDAETAQDLLLADEVEAAFVPHPDDEEPRMTRRRVVLGLSARQLFAGIGILVMASTAAASRLHG